MKPVLAANVNVVTVSSYNSITDKLIGCSVELTDVVLTLVNKNMRQPRGFTPHRYLILRMFTKEHQGAKIYKDIS